MDLSNEGILDSIANFQCSLRETKIFGLELEFIFLTIGEFTFNHSIALIISMLACFTIIFLNAGILTALFYSVLTTILVAFMWGLFLCIGVLILNP